jgi:hypothetical protein
MKEATPPTSCAPLVTTYDNACLTPPRRCREWADKGTTNAQPKKGFKQYWRVQALALAIFAKEKRGISQNVQVTREGTSPGAFEPDSPRSSRAGCLRRQRASQPPARLVKMAYRGGGDCVSSFATFSFLGPLFGFVNSTLRVAPQPPLSLSSLSSPSHLTVPTPPPPYARCRSATATSGTTGTSPKWAGRSRTSPTATSAACTTWWGPCTSRMQSVHCCRRRCCTDVCRVCLYRVCV